MNVILNKDIRNRLLEAFPQFFINYNLEIIIYPATNSYFLLENLESELELNCKILEYLSREASKSLNSKSRKYHLDGINKFLNTNFTTEEMTQIYTKLGNGCKRSLCIKFIQSGYDLKLLEE